SGETCGGRSFVAMGGRGAGSGCDLRRALCRCERRKTHEVRGGSDESHSRGLLCASWRQFDDSVVSEQVEKLVEHLGTGATGLAAYAQSEVRVRSARNPRTRPLRWRDLA